MLLVDPRVGSGNLLDYILELPGHPPAEHSTLLFGDVCFTGNGPKGAILVGIELKNVSDALNCIESERFTGHQLPGLKETYDAVYIIIQGEYRAERTTGALQIKLDKGKGAFWWDVKTGARTWSHYEFQAWLTMIELGWGIRSRTTKGMKDTARTVVEMWRVLQKPWDEHRTIHPFYLGPDIGSGAFVKPSLVERVVAQVDGIGPAKAREIGKRFKSVANMIASIEGIITQPDFELTDAAQNLVSVFKAGTESWKGIPGVGKSTAQKIIRQMWGVNSKAADLPSCPDCGTPMVHSGATFKCANCGSTSGCS